MDVWSRIYKLSSRTKKQSSRGAPVRTLSISGERISTGADEPYLLTNSI